MTGVAETTAVLNVGPGNRETLAVRQRPERCWTTNFEDVETVKL